MSKARRLSGSSHHRSPSQAAQPARSPAEQRRERLLAAVRRAAVLVALVCVASSSRGDTPAAIPDGTPAPTSPGLLWSPSATYATGNVVEYQGHLYRAAAPNTDSPPGASSALWTPYDPETYGPGTYGALSQVTPVVNCIYRGTNGGALSTTFTAVFGYTNTGTTTVVAPIQPVGPDMNAVNGGEMGQATTFAPGVHNAAFAVTSPMTTALTWTLGTQSATTANSSAPACAVTSTSDGLVATVGGVTIGLSLDTNAILASATRATELTLGASAGGFQVGQDGSATYSMPLWTPPARMGIGPNLSLSYSSRQGRSSLGVGWALTGFGISRITRCQNTVAQDHEVTPIDFSSGDAFCLDGQRLIYNGVFNDGRILYGPEHDPFTRVLFDSKALQFEVDLQDGRVLTYGTTTGSKHQNSQVIWSPNPGSSQGENINDDPINIASGDVMLVYAWGLDSVTDPSGNRMTVSYETKWEQEPLAPTSCTELLPTAISYTAGASSPAQRSVVIDWEIPATPEPSCRYVSGFGVGGQARIRQISMFGPGPNPGEGLGTTGISSLRTYTMTYEQSPTTSRSRLHSVQECAAPYNCKVPTTFTYHDASLRFREVTVPKVPDPTAGSDSPVGFVQVTERQFRDVNGDGKDDLLFQAMTLPTLTNWHGGPANLGVYTPPFPVAGFALSDGTSFGNTTITFVGDIDNFTLPSLPTPYSEMTNSNGAVVDVAPSTGYCKFAYNHYSCTGAGLLRAGSAAYTFSAPFFIADLDGNGASDLLGTSPSSGGGVSWTYWLNFSDASPQPPPAGTAKPPALSGHVVTASVSPLDQSMYAYTAHLDGTAKVAFLGRSGGTTTGSEAPTLLAITADAESGDARTSVTTLPTGVTYTLQPPPVCTPDNTPGAKPDPTCCTPTDANPCLPVLVDSSQCTNPGQCVPEAFRYVFLDLNADGNDDAIEVSATAGTILGVRFNTGTGFGKLSPLPGVSSDPAWALPAIANAKGTTWPAPRAGVAKVGDLNGDGLPDLLIANNTNAADTAQGGAIVAYLSNGANGVVPTPLVDQNGSAIHQGGVNDEGSQTVLGPDVWGQTTPWGVDVLDFDGDGRMDVYANGNVYVQQTSGTDVLTTVVDGLGKTTSVGYATLGRDSADTGLAGNAGALGRLYEPATDCRYPIQCVVKGMDVVSYYETSPDPGGTTSWGRPPRVEFEYAGGRSDMRGRGWLGFSGMSSFDWTTQTTITTTYQPPDTDTGYGYPLAGMPIYGTVTTPAGQGNVRTQTTTRTYDVVQTFSGRSAIARPREAATAIIESNQAGSFTTTISGSTTTLGYDATTVPFHLTSRATTWQESGEVNTWSATYTSNTANGKWLLSLLNATSETSSVPGQPAVTRTHAFYPDPNTGLMTGESGQDGGAPDVASWAAYVRNENGQIIQTTVKAMDPIRSVPIVRHSYLTYDSFDGVFPSSSTNDLGQTNLTVYHPGLGVLAFAEDPNGVKVHTTFDAFGRQLSVMPDGGATTTYTYKQGQPYGESSATNATQITVETDVAGGGQTIVTYNMLGDEVVRGARNHDGTFSYVETGYNANVPGQVGTVSLPHAYGVAALVTTYLYDEMGRPTGSLLPDGNRTAISYVGRATTLTDANGYAQTRVADDLGRLVRLDEDDRKGVTYPTTAVYQRPTSAISTNYAYGPNNVLNQISVTARASQGGATAVLSTMTYDALGRRTSITDADTGSITTTYDAFGELMSETDGNGDIHIPTRDVLGRVVADYSSKDGITSYQWDTAANGIGKLASAASPDQVTTQYTYDLFGRPQGTTWTIPSQGSYALSTTGYDSYGRPAGIAYPSGYGVSITFGYDKAGGVSAITTPSGELGWNASQWQADGRITAETYGSTLLSSGVHLPDAGTTTRTYDPRRGWARLIETDSPSLATLGLGTTVQKLTYDYDASGNLTKRSDGVAATVETFHNDFVNRLDTWSFGPTSAATTTFTYTDLGNLAQRTRSTGPGLSTTTVYASGTRDAIGTPGAAGVHGVTEAGADSYAYDTKGNQTSGAGRTIGYSSFNLPKTITTASGTTTFLYDANHQRVAKKGPSGTTVSIGGLYERRTDAQGAVTDVFYVPGGDGRIVAQEQVSEAKPTLPRVYYLHDDSLGSIESVTGYWDSSRVFKGVGVVTVPNELAVLHFKYDPFGQRMDPATGLSSSTPPSADVTTGFTAQEHDDELGLINMRGRIYDPNIARFLSVDPLARGESQRLNTYSYVSNNPLNFTDPSGFDPKDNGVSVCPQGQQNNTAGINQCPQGGGNAPPINPDGSQDVWVHGAPRGSSAPPPDDPPADDSNGPIRGTAREGMDTYNGYQASGAHGFAPVDYNSQDPMGGVTAEGGLEGFGRFSKGAALEVPNMVVNTLKLAVVTLVLANQPGLIAPVVRVVGAIPSVPSPTSPEAKAGAITTGIVVSALPMLGAVSKVGAGVEVAEEVAAEEAPALAKGGVYALRDAEGEVARTGRTNDLVRRAAEHLRDPATEDLTFETLYRTDAYAEQRGLEQVAHNEFNPPLNKIRPISPLNPRGPSYMTAARKFLGLE